MTRTRASRRRPHRSLLLVVLAAMAAAGLTFATPASAATLEINYAQPISSTPAHTDATVRNQYAWGTFDDDGDRFYVLDSYPDSMRVAIHWKLKSGARQGLCINNGHGFWYECNKDLPEHQTVLIRVGRCDGDAHSCEVLANYRDWTAYDSTSTS